MLWAVLLMASQALDVVTTVQDRARGMLESMPVSESLMQRGIGVWWGVKFLLVVAAATALVLTARWIRHGKGGSRTVFRLALVCVQAATIGLVAVSLSNVILLGSIAH